MVTQIKTFKENALALEITDAFTATDASLVEKLFEEKLNKGYEHINVLIKVKDMSILKHMDLKGFLKGEIWGLRHFNKIGRCAVVAHSDAMKAIVNIESKALHFVSPALEEKYFDAAELDDALKFISPNE